MKMHEPNEKITDALTALSLLKEGNERYLRNTQFSRTPYENARTAFTQGQNPFAAVLCCSDSRVAPEIFFDQGLGDLFVIRNAGNVADSVVLGSAEYAAEHLNVPLIAVIGHSSCGAVNAAVSGGELPENILAIAEYIRPSCTHGRSADETAEAHAVRTAELIRNDEIIKHMKTLVVPAFYNVVSGEVSWLA